MKYASIPTKYRGINMRSRLEAKWACMFDLLGWKWEYEPIDLNGWIPDFAISDARKNIKGFGASELKSITLIEIKPIFEFNYDYDTIMKIERAINAPLNEDRECDSDEWEEFFKNSPYDFALLGAELIADNDFSYDYKRLMLGRLMQFTFGWMPFATTFSNDFLRSSWAEATNQVQWNSKV